MPTKRKRSPAPTMAKRATESPRNRTDLPETPQPFLAGQLAGSQRKGASGSGTTPRAKALSASQRQLSDAGTFEAKVPLTRLPREINASMAALESNQRRFHGAKLSLAWFPRRMITSPCTDRFGYLSSGGLRAHSRLPFTLATQSLLTDLGALMADPGRDVHESTVPAGFTYVGQFIDHDITLDVSSRLDARTDANLVHNMRTPALDLDSVYGRGPALDAFLFAFPSTGPTTAIKFQLGTNRATGPGGSGGSAQAAGMSILTNFDVPRMGGTNTAIIGDPRNDENLVVSQIHHAMLRFHNKVVDALVARSFSGDVFVEAQRIVRHHYQWAVVHDFLKRICGATAVTAALKTVSAPKGSAFRMPVEFSVAAYRFGHSMVRERYWLSFAQTGATMSDVFTFVRNPNLPVLSNWVVDFNAFFETGISVPVFNRARAFDSVLTPQLKSLPGMNGLMAMLAARNLQRSLALGLPSGQAMAKHFGIPPLSTAELTEGLPLNEVAVLQRTNGLLLSKTPLWYYVLREAAVRAGGEQLGPVGARIVAETFVRMLKRDPGSYLQASAPGFKPTLPAVTPGDFTFADLVLFAGVVKT